MAKAKLVSASVRPFQVAHLSFAVGGILGEPPVPAGGAAPVPIQLGSAVTPFDFSTFYGNLGAVVPTAGDLSRLVYDSQAIQTDPRVQASTLAVLRAEDIGAALDKAVNSRQNAFYKNYWDPGGFAGIIQANYGLTTTKASWPPGTTKPLLLQELNTLSQTQDGLLETAYTTPTDLRAFVVTQTTSDIVGRSFDEQFSQPNTYGNLSPPPPGGKTYGPIPFGPYATWEETEASSGQTITNTDYKYNVPYIERKAQYVRAQISLIDQYTAAFLASFQLPKLETIFLNELASIDLDVKRLQIAYLNTILMSPIPGIVTGVYKNPGDAVKAGDPVIRVENSAVILVVTVLIYRGPISINSSTVTFKTSLFDSSSSPTTLSGTVVAARGQQQDDQWEVIVQCDNLDSSGNPIFPLGYKFDYDDTTVSIT
jgi:hypothetical protein